MKRAGRWLFNIVAAVSLLLSLAAAIAWPISYVRSTIAFRNTPDGRQTSILLLDHRIYLMQGPNQQIVPTSVTYQWNSSPNQVSHRPILHIGQETVDDISLYYVLGFVLASGPKLHFLGVGIPLWFPLLIFAGPAIAWWRHRLRTVFLPNHCKQCGYDLRASPDRCPECGTIPAVKGAAI